MDTQKTVKVEFSIRSWYGGCTLGNDHIITKVTPMDIHTTGPVVNLKPGDLDGQSPALSGGEFPQGNISLSCQIIGAPQKSGADAGGPKRTPSRGENLPGVLQP